MGAGGEQPRAINWRERLPRLQRTGIWALVVGVACYALVGVIFDGGLAAAHALPPLRHPWLLPLLLVLAPTNYLLRYFKWLMYTRRLGFRQVPWRQNLLIFVGGLGLSVTPGKMGELVKSWFLWDRYQIPAARSAPMVVADRLTDFLAMLILATGGAVLLGHGRVPYALIVVMVLLVAAMRSRRVALWLIGQAARIPRLRPLQDKMHELLDSGQTLLAADVFAAAVGLGLIGWGLEGLVVFVAMAVFGGHIPIAGAEFVLASASLIGGISGLPGGVGAAEGVMTGLLVWLGVPFPLAVMVMLISRFATLWLGVAVGLTCLAALQAGGARRAGTAAVRP